jgi:hypothetical protein
MAEYKDPREDLERKSQEAFAAGDYATVQATERQIDYHTARNTLDARTQRADAMNTPTSSSGASGAAPSGDVTGLDTAIRFYGGVAASAQAGVAETEAAIAALQTGGVTGEGITELQQAMESLGRAAPAFTAARNTLQQHTQVGDSYNANPGAGTREFVTGE